MRIVSKRFSEANIKLASVATDALGASRGAMLEAILADEEDAGKLAEMSKGLLRNKIPELQLALEGRVTEHHAAAIHERSAHAEAKVVAMKARSIGACALSGRRSLD